MLSVEPPIKTVSEANSHTHWRQRQKRAKLQRFVAKSMTRSQAAMMATLRTLEEVGSLTVRLTRIAPRSLDSDNLAGSQKHVRDGVADALGINDNDPRVTWLYAQARGAPKAYGVRIEIWSEAERA